MKILIPPSEGKAKIQKPQDILFKDTNFVFETFWSKAIQAKNMTKSDGTNGHNFFS